jgi:hypothetical protein
MPEYEYHHETFDEDGTIELPDDAIGITTDSMGDFEDGLTVHVKYLTPVEDS